MIKLENEYYIRFILLLIKGGTKVLREIVYRGLKRQKTSLNDLLNANKVQICCSEQITKTQRDVLYPPSPNCSDISKWDISLLSYIALVYMGTVLNGVEKRAVEKLRHIRNDVHAHSTAAEIEPRTFTHIWNELSLLITTLSQTMSGEEREKLNNLISSLSSDQLDIYAAIEELKLLERRDEFFECIHTSLKNIQQSQSQLTVAVSNFHQEDSAIETPLCERYLTKQCTGQGCRLMHCKTSLPYMWQVKLCSDWINLKELEYIEQAYCNNQDMFYEEIRLVHNELEFSVVVMFRPQVRAIAIVIGTQDDGTHTEARRLSTMSYKEGTSNPDSFKTQWRWYWVDDYNKWLLFEPAAMQHTLEVKFLAKQREFYYLRDNYRFEYIVDFNEMTQRNINTRTLRNISRRPVFVSQNDVKGKHYPKFLTAAPVVETPLPHSWVPWDMAFPFELVRLDESDPKYTQVSDSFFKTLDRGQIEIDTIFRIQNHKLWNLYYNQEKMMEADLKRLGNDTSVDKRYLFHGTDSVDAVRGISINNFDARVSGKNATMYGDGAYFARDAKYSHTYTKGPDRFMFLVTVLVGQYTKGDTSYRRPPNKPGRDHELYDSCVNDINNPSIFIVFDKNQYYPEFLIQYHKLFEESEDTHHAQYTGTVPQKTAHVGTSAVRQHGAVGGVNVRTMEDDVSSCCIQ